MLRNILVMMLFPLYLFAWQMESGTVKLEDTYDDGNWVTVHLKQRYSTPPLIFTLPTTEGGQPSALRLKNITNDSFEVLQVEPSGNDGPHIPMTIHYIAIDSGEHYLPDGTKIVAGKISTIEQQASGSTGITPTGWESISFANSFDNPPIVLGMIQTLNNEVGNIPTEPSVPFLTTVIDHIDENGFDIALERSQVKEGNVTNNETIAYMAIDNNKQGIIKALQGDILYETASKDEVKGYNNGCYTYDYQNSYSDAPNVVSTKQTRRGSDGGWLRRCSLDSTQVGITVDEDQYYDSERGHISELAGIVVFEKDFSFDSKLLAPIAEYRMDDCTWSGSGSFDVVDTVASNNAEAYENAVTNHNDAIVNFSGDMGTQGYIQPADTIELEPNWTLSFWMKFPLNSDDHKSHGWFMNYYYYFAFGSISGDGDLAGFTLDTSDNLGWMVYNEDGDAISHDLSDISDGWHHIVCTKTDDNTTTLYVDGSKVDSIDLGSTGDIDVLLTSDDDSSGDAISTPVDELKVWNRALGLSDINLTYQNEKAGKNYDASPRDTIECFASIKANSWELIGIPADLRKESDTSIDKIFGDDMTGSYGTDWRIYKREYSDTNNSSWYTYISDSSEALEFGVGYWLGSKKDENWSVNDMAPVDYDYSGDGCVALSCVELDIKSVSLDESAGDDLEGTGPYRYFMTGFVGNSPVSWSDCRFVIDGTVYTPSDAESAGYLNKQIWQYNPDSMDADSNGYTTCDDVTPGSCKLIPYKGFWIEMQGPSKDKIVKLLIPKE